MKKKEWRLLALKYEKRKNEDEDRDSSFSSYINWKSEKWKYIGEVKKRTGRDRDLKVTQIYRYKKERMKMS